LFATSAKLGRSGPASKYEHGGFVLSRLDAADGGRQAAFSIDAELVVPCRSLTSPLISRIDKRSRIWFLGISATSRNADNKLEATDVCAKDDADATIWKGRGRISFPMQILS
jgi:hypothetical protein